MRDLLSIAEVNTTAAQEYVSKISCAHHTIKEVVRDMHTNLPFACLLRATTVALVYIAIFQKNIWPNKLGASERFSLRKIVTRCTAFGTYAEGHASKE